MLTRLPALFQETIDGRTYYTVESACNESAHLVDLGDEGFVIDPQYYFVIGDNRDDSKDSRFLGPIARDLLVGRGLLVYLSFDFHDDVCKEYVRLRRRFPEAVGFKLPDFPPGEQARHCGDTDGNRIQGPTAIGAYLRHQVRRWGRVSPRWSRIGNLL